MNERTLHAVEVFETELCERLYRQNDEDRVFADLTGLFLEIIGEVSKTDSEKSLIIYDYAKLLERELQLYSGTEAYITGRGAKDIPEWDALFAYLRKIVNDNNAQRLDASIQTFYSEIAELLGDKSGLIAEFTETYRMTHGAVKNNITEFIRMGQASGAEAEVSV